MAAFRSALTTPFDVGARSSGTRRQSKSSRVGSARMANGQVTTAYRALEGLACSQCHGEIAVGEVFLRRAVWLTPGHGHGRGLTQAPVCARCCPLTVTEGGQEDG